MESRNVIPDYASIALDTEGRVALLTTEALLIMYGEWLDEQGVIAPESENDKRTHEDMARQFLWEMFKSPDGQPAD